MGANIPLPALDIHTQQNDPLANYAKIMGLKSQIQEQQLRQQQIKDQQATTAAAKNWDGKDYDALSKSVLQNGGSANAALAVQQHGLTIKKTVSDIAAQDATTGSKNLETFIGKHKAIGDSLQGIENVPDEQLHQKAIEMVTDLAQNGIFDPQHAQQMITQIQATPDAQTLRSQIDLVAKNSLGAKAVAEQEAKQADILRSKSEANKADAETEKIKSATQWYKDNGMAPGVPAQDVEMSDWLSKNPGKGPSDYEVAMKKVVPSFNFNLQQGALGDAATDQAAQRYLQTGQLPTGMRSPAMVSKIINRAGELGGNQSITANTASFEANRKSYDNATQTLDTLTAFENVGKKNLENFLNLAKDIPDTGIPWLNKPVRTLTKDVVGSDKMPAIDAARTVALREIARITNDPKLKGVLTDSSRNEVEHLIPENATLPQIRAVAKVLIQDVNNVHESVAAQKADIGKRIGIPDSAAQPTKPQFTVPAGAPPAPRDDGHKLKMNGNVVAVSKGGQWGAP